MSLHMLFDSSWINSHVLHQYELLTPLKYEYVKEDTRVLIIPLPPRQSVREVTKSLEKISGTYCQAPDS